MMRTRKFIASFLAFSVTVQTVQAVTVPNDFWQDRRQVHLPHVDVGPITPLIPISREAFQNRIQPKNIMSSSDSLEVALSPFVTVQSVQRSQDPHSKTIYLLQDAHLLPEAQLNIAQAINVLSHYHQNIPIGLEATDVAQANFSAYHDYPHLKSLRETAEAMVKMSILNGAEYAAIGLRSSIEIIGVENEAEYQANVKALRESVSHKLEVATILDTLHKELQALKDMEFNKDQKKFDTAFMGYQEGRLSVADYVLTLDSIISASTPQIKKIIAVHLMEGSFNLTKVETERNRFLEQLIKSLGEPEINELIQRSQKFSTKQNSAADYYGFLRKVAKRHHVALSQFHELNLYLQYVIKSQEIQVEALFHEIRSLERDVIVRLYPKQEQQELIRQTKIYFLTQNLINHSLVSTEWDDYAETKKRLVSEGSIEKWSVPQKNRWAPSLSKLLTAPALKPFEDFYMFALKRNETMAQKLLGHMAKNPAASVGVLVAGGFHTTGLKDEIRNRGFSVITLSPRLSEIKEGLSSLDILVSGQLPLEKLFQGERLFLGVPPASIASATAQQTANVTLAGAEAHHTGQSAVRGGVQATANAQGQISFQRGPTFSSLIWRLKTWGHSIISRRLAFISVASLSFFNTALLPSISVTIATGLGGMGLLLVGGCTKPDPVESSVNFEDIEDESVSVTRLFLIGGEDAIGLWRQEGVPNSVAQDLIVDNETGIISVNFRKNLLNLYSALAPSFTRASVDDALDKNDGYIYLDLRGEVKTFGVVIQSRNGGQVLFRGRFSGVVSDRFRRLIIPESVFEKAPVGDITIAIENTQSDQNGLLEVRVLRTSSDDPNTVIPKVDLSPIKTLLEGRLFLSGVDPIIWGDFGNASYITDLRINPRDGQFFLSTLPTRDENGQIIPHLRNGGYAAAMVTGASVRRAFNETNGLHFAFQGAIPEFIFSIGSPDHPDLYRVRVQNVQLESPGILTISKSDLEAAFATQGLSLTLPEFQIGFSILNHEGTLGAYFLKPNSSVPTDSPDEIIRLVADVAQAGWGVLADIENNLIWGDVENDPFVTGLSVNPENGELLINTNPLPGQEPVRDTGFVGAVVTGGSFRQKIQENSGRISFQFRGSIPRVIFQLGTPEQSVLHEVQLEGIPLNSYGTYELTESQLVTMFSEAGLDFYKIPRFQIGFVLKDQGDLQVRFLRFDSTQDPGEPPLTPVAVVPEQYDPGYVVLADVSGNVIHGNAGDRPFVTSLRISPPTNLIEVNTMPLEGQEHIREAGFFGFIGTGESVRQELDETGQLKFQFEGSIPEVEILIGTPLNPIILRVRLNNIIEGTYGSFVVSRADLEAAFQEAGINFSTVSRFQFGFIVRREGILRVIVLRPLAGFYDTDPAEIFARAFTESSDRITKVIRYFFQFVSSEGVVPLINALRTELKRIGLPGHPDVALSPPLKGVIDALRVLLTDVWGTHVVWKAPPAIKTENLTKEFFDLEDSIRSRLNILSSLFKFGGDKSFSFRLGDFEGNINREDLAVIQKFPVRDGGDFYLISASRASINRIMDQSKDLQEIAKSQGVLLNPTEALTLAVDRFLIHEIGEEVLGIEHEILRKHGLGPDLPTPNLMAFSTQEMIGVLQFIISGMRIGSRDEIKDVELIISGKTIRSSPQQLRETALAMTKRFLPIRDELHRIIGQLNAKKISLSYKTPSDGFENTVPEKLALTPSALRDLILVPEDMPRLELIAAGILGNNPRASMEVFEAEQVGSPDTLAIFDQKGGFKDVIDLWRAFMNKHPNQRFRFAVMQMRKDFISDLERYIRILNNKEGAGGTELVHADDFLTALEKNRIDLIPLNPDLVFVYENKTGSVDVTSAVDYFKQVFEEKYSSAPQKIALISDWRNLTVEARLASLVTVIFSVSLYVVDFYNNLKIQTLAATQA